VSLRERAFQAGLPDLSGERLPPLEEGDGGARPAGHGGRGGGRSGDQGGGGSGAGGEGDAWWARQERLAALAAADPAWTPALRQLTSAWRPVHKFGLLSALVGNDKKKRKRGK
jgi:hypothetical protein